MPGLDTRVPTGTRREVMSLPEGRLTRRQILSGAAALPVLAMAKQTLAQTPSPAASPTTTGGEQPAPPAPLPEGQLTWVLEDAETRHSLNKKQLKSYSDTAEMLWHYFALGVDHGGEGEITIPPENEILKAAYIYKSGLEIAKNLKNGKYPPDGNHGETNVCAYNCGVHAAIAAQYDGSKMIERDIYEKAWEVTKKEAKSRFASAAALNPGGEEGPLPQSGGGPTRSLPHGGGC
jgi:hypothetical protein